MSKIISIDSLTKLREKIRSKENYISEFNFDQLDFFNLNKLELLDAPEYPEINSEVINNFYDSFKNNPNDEFELARIIYEGIRIPRSLAANNQYWIYINLKYFSKYIKTRWIEKTTNSDVDFLKNIEKYFLNLEPSQNSLIKSPIAGLWWAIELSLNPSGTKYHFSKIFLSERNLRDKNIGTYRLIRNNDILLTLLGFYNIKKEAKIDNEKIGSEAIAQQMSKTLNQIGGLTVLSYLEYGKVLGLLEENEALILKRAKIVKDNKKKSAEKIQNNKSINNAITLNRIDKINKEIEESSKEMVSNRELIHKSNFFVTNFGNVFYRNEDIPTNEAIRFHSKVKFNNESYLFLGYENGNIVKLYMSVFQQRSRNYLLNGVNIVGLKFIHYDFNDIDIAILSKNKKCTVYNTVNIVNPIRTISSLGSAIGVNILNLKYGDRVDHFKLLRDTNLTREEVRYFRKNSRAIGYYLIGKDVL